VAIDPAGGQIYWTNQSGGTVRRAKLDGSSPPETLVTGEPNPLGVALDVAAGKIYWTNLNIGAVRRANSDGSSAETLVDASSAAGPAAVAGPAGIAIDPAGKLYWANFFGGTIWSANLSDGSNPAQLVGGGGPGGQFPNLPALLRAPVGSAPPAISGNATVGSEHSCSTGSWSPDLIGAFLFRQPRDFSYQWQLTGSDITGADGSTFTPGTPGSYTCRVTASNQAGSASQTSPAFDVGSALSALSLLKFYDKNANGHYDTGTESAISHWQVSVDGVGTFLTPATVSLSAGSYVARESTPSQANWLATTAKAVQVSLGASDQTTVSFGNVCIGGGGAMGSGFWANKNGEALFGLEELASMIALNLRNTDGTAFNPLSYSTFKTWLKKASATNMAYALSAQLAAMKLNVSNAKVNGAALIYAPGTTSANAKGFATVNAVTAEANVELGIHGLTKSGSSFRRYQASLQSALVKANGNVTFVQATPCAFTFP
jgi:hypothetical protein